MLRSSRSQVVGVVLVAFLVAVSCGDDGGGGGVIEGTVTVEGETSEGIVVELHETSGSGDDTDFGQLQDQDPVAEAETGADGTYQLDGVADGEFIVSADVGDITTASSCSVVSLAEIEDAATLTIDFEVPEGWEPRGPIDLLLDGHFLLCG